MQITSLMLIKQFHVDWLRVTSLGDIETAVKSRFAELGLSTSDSIWDLLLLFKSWLP